MTRHGQAALTSLGRLIRRPIATLVTVLAIAVALSLPLVLYIMLENAHRAMGGLEGTALSSRRSCATIWTETQV